MSSSTKLPLASGTFRHGHNPVDVAYSICGEFDETQRILILDGLLSGGPEVNAVGSCGWTLLHRASIDGEERLVEALLKRPGIDVGARCGPDEETALMAAAKHGRSGIVRLLLQEGAAPRPGNPQDVNARNRTGATALMAAAANGHVESVLVLIVNGADYALKDRGGETALDLAKRNNHTETAEALERVIAASQAGS